MTLFINVVTEVGKFRTEKVIVVSFFVLQCTNVFAEDFFCQTIGSSIVEIGVLQSSSEVV